MPTQGYLQTKWNSLLPALQKSAGDAYHSQRWVFSLMSAEQAAVKNKGQHLCNIKFEKHDLKWVHMPIFVQLLLSEMFWVANSCRKSQKWTSNHNQEMLPNFCTNFTSKTVDLIKTIKPQMYILCDKYIVTSLNTRMLHKHHGRSALKGGEYPSSALWVYCAFTTPISTTDALYLSP